LRIVQRLLEGTPVTERGQVRAWPSLAHLAMSDFLRMPIRTPVSWAAPDAPCEVVAAALISHGILEVLAQTSQNSTTPDLLGTNQCEELLRAATQFWGPVRHLTVAQVLAPQPLASGFYTPSSEHLPSGPPLVQQSVIGLNAEVRVWRVASEARVTAALVGPKGATLAILSLNLPTPEAPPLVQAAYSLRSIEVRKDYQGKGVGCRFVLAVCQALHPLFPHVRDITSTLTPPHFPEILSQSLAAEYLWQAWDAREALSHFEAKVQAEFRSVLADILHPVTEVGS
jgi:hypothetical protein